MKVLKKKRKVTSKRAIFIGVAIIIILVIFFIFNSSNNNKSTNQQKSREETGGILATVSAKMRDASNKLSQAQKIAQVKNLSSDQQQQVVMLIQGAIDDSRVAVKAQPDKAKTWYMLSQTYRQLIGFGQNADQFAIIGEQQAIQIEPKNYYYHFQLGSLYYQLKRYNDAIEEYKVAIALNPHYANLYYNLGYAYKMAGERQQAKIAFQTALNLLSSNDKNHAILEKEINSL